MAREVIEQFVDDLDGSDKEVSTVKFALDGRAYEIDLSADNAEDFRNLFTPYINAGRKERASLTQASSRAAKAAGGVQRAHSSEYLQDVRDWARARGYQVADRGRISSKLLSEYEAASV